MLNKDLRYFSLGRRLTAFSINIKVDLSTLPVSNPDDVTKIDILLINDSQGRHLTEPVFM